MAENSSACIRYQARQLARFYAAHRRSWAEFYPSEHEAFARAAGPDNDLGLVLDAGCGAGGLGLALGERFGLRGYVGVDIHAGAVAAGQAAGGFACPARLIAGDILAVSDLEPASFDTVTSLSCADWNLETTAILAACWRYVRPGGRFVLTLRLSPLPTLMDMGASYQYLSFEDAPPEDCAGLERAPYVVLNTGHALSLLAGLSPAPASIFAYGYWGAPSPTAVLPYDRLAFTALTVTKPEAGTEIAATRAELHLPADAFFAPGEIPGGGGN